MKIMFVITGLGVGGAEKVVINLADSLVLLGHEVSIVFLKGFPVVVPKSSLINLICLELDSLRQLPSAIHRLRREIIYAAPDVVHSHLYHANIFCRMLRLVVPMNCLITTAHNNHEGGLFRMSCYRLTNSLSDAFTNVSGEAVDAFVRHGAAKAGELLTIYNGICTDSFKLLTDSKKIVYEELGMPSDQKLIIAVGRLNKEKDYANLFEALSLLEPRLFDYLLVIAGDGPLEGELKLLVEQKNLISRVRFLGVRQDIPELLSAADLYVLSSVSEGFPLVVGEAMACEKFVVATDCGGVKEFMGNTGILVPPNDSNALAAELANALMLTKAARVKAGKLARDRIVSNYSLTSSVDKWIALYNSKL